MDCGLQEYGGASVAATGVNWEDERRADIYMDAFLGCYPRCRLGIRISVGDIYLWEVLDSYGGGRAERGDRVAEIVP